jgi:hypothetical protein
MLLILDDQGSIFKHYELYWHLNSTLHKVNDVLA